MLQEYTLLVEHWWHRPSSPSTREAEASDLSKLDLSKSSQGYTEEPCFRKQTNRIYSVAKVLHSELLPAVKFHHELLDQASSEAL